MGDGDNGAGILLQVLFQPCHRFGIQVVGGFVEQQDVRLFQQQAAKGHPAPLPTGDDVHRRVTRRAAQGIHGHFQPGIQVPCVQGV
jgi:hypothetical protein